MFVDWKKTSLGALAALTFGLSVATPATAQYYGPRGGWGPPPPRYYNNGGISPGGAAALGVLGGLAIGAAAASAANAPRYADPGPAYYSQCWYEPRIITDEFGTVIGRRRVRICN